MSGSEPQIIEFAFPGPIRDRLVSLILAGEKTATTSLLREFDTNGEEFPRVGATGTVVSSQGEPVAQIEITDVRVARLGDVDDAHAIAEGEGNSGYADWRVSHERYWRSPEMCAALGETPEINDDTMLVLERFRLVD